MNLLLVAPFNCDPEFEEKYLIVNELCVKSNICLLSIGGESNSDFNAVLSVSIYQACDIAIVDLTMERPSCYYELGFLEALEKKLAIIAKFGTIVHQTLNKENIEGYENLFSYREAIAKAINKLLI